MEKEQKSLDFSKFVFERVLCNHSDKKEIIILGHFNDKNQEDKAILRIEKQPFTEEDLISEEGALKYERQESFFNNDVYYKDRTFLSEKNSLVITQSIYPAEEKFILKYSE